MTKKILFSLFSLLALLAACSDDDSFTQSPTALLSFSRDTVTMDTVFTTVGSRTYDLWVYNRSAAGLRIASVRLRQGNQTGLRVNVDGTYLDNSLGSIATGLELRKGDSLRVFVELTAAENGFTEAQPVADDLLFALESGITQKVHLSGFGWDAIFLDNEVIHSDTTIESQKPIVVYGGITVDSLATLTLRNTTLFFHDQAGLDVYGTLVADSVVLRGDRLDHIFDYLPYDRVSGQWHGVTFHSSSFGNQIINSVIRNAMTGIRCDSAQFYGPDRQRLYMEDCVVHNCKGPGIETFNSYVGLLRCQLSNTLGDCLAVYGGAVVADHCTLAQFYPFSADRGAALRFANYYGDYAYPLHTLRMTSSIVTGYEADVVMGSCLEGDTATLFSYYFENTLLRTDTAKVGEGRQAVADTIKFRSIMWESPKDSVQGKQHFRLIDEDNLIYDFHLDSISTAHGKGCYES